MAIEKQLLSSSQVAEVDSHGMPSLGDIFSVINRSDRLSNSSAIIQSTKNALVQSVTKLHRASYRREKQLFLLEGTHLILEAVACHWPLQSLFATEEWYELHRDGPLSSSLKENTLHIVSPHVLSHIASTETPDGIVAVAKFQESNPSTGRTGIPTKGEPPLQVAVDGLQDPGNLGTLLRASVAADASDLLLGAGSVDPYHPKVLRSTAGQWFRMPPRSVDLINHMAQCKTEGIRIFAAAASGESYWAHDFRGPSLLILGNEGAGVSPGILQMADTIVSIPMARGVESLNVAMAGTLLLYEARRQRSLLSR